MLHKMNRMNRVERKRMVKGKQWMVLSTTALALGMVAFGGTEASAHEYTPATWEARMPNEIQITDRSNYLIIWGDTLWAISEASGVSVDALVSINNIANRDLIFAGNTLVIDGNVVTVTEANGEKSSFVVEQDNVTKTNNHAEADKTVAVVTNEVKNNVNTDTVKEETSKTDNADKQKEAVTEKDADAKPVEGSVDEDEDGGNFSFVGDKDETPADEKPVVVTPADETPAIETPADETPVVETPVVEAPADEEEDGGNFEFVNPETPVVNEDETDYDDAEEPIVEEPVIEEPAVEEPVIEEPVVEEPVVEEPVVEEDGAVINAQRVDTLRNYLNANVSDVLEVVDSASYGADVDYSISGEQSDFPGSDFNAYAKAVEEIRAHLDSQGIQYEEEHVPGWFQFSGKF